MVQPRSPAASLTPELSPLKKKVMSPCSSSSVISVMLMPSPLRAQFLKAGLLSGVNSVLFLVPGHTSPRREFSLLMLSASMMSTYWWEGVLLTELLSHTD